MGILTLTSSFLQAQLNQKRSRQAILTLREKKLRKILLHAYTHSTFYHNLYSKAGITEADLSEIPLNKLPTIDKEILMKNFDEITITNAFSLHDLRSFLEEKTLFERLFLNKYHVVHTSGSSGNIGIFVYDQQDWDRFFPYSTRLFDFHFRRNKSAFFGAVDGHYIGVSFNRWLGKGITKLFVKPLILDVTKPLHDSITKLNSFQPTILGGYFNALKILAEQQEQGTLQIHPEHIVSCGEAIIPHDKEYIEEIFNAPLSNLYGLAECPFLGAGKNQYQGIYLMDDIAYVEIMDDHVLLTNLFNFTQPLIRYKIADFFTYKEDTQHLLPFTLIDDIIGRSEAMIWLRNENGDLDFIHPIVFSEFYVKGLNRLQIHIKNESSFDFFAEIKGEEPEIVIPKIEEKLRHILAEKRFTTVDFNIRLIDRIDVNQKTGKFQLVVQPSN
jgi:phenylacetate-CoA ligase